MGFAFEFFAIFSFDIDVIHAQCILGYDFLARYAARVFVPFCIVSVFCIQCFVSRKVLGDSGMGVEKTMNAVGLFSSMAFITCSKMTLQFFECFDEGGITPDTLSAYPDINCGEDAVGKAEPVAVIFTMVNIVFFLSVVFYLCFIAPTKYQHADFRMSTAFLLRRWRPTIWWFAFIPIVRNLFISLTGTIYPSNGAAQLMLCGFFSTMYMICTATGQPWRSPAANRTDVVVTGFLTMFCYYSVPMVKMEDTLDDRVADFGPFAIFFFAGAWCSLVLMFLHALHFMFTSQENDEALSLEAARHLRLLVKTVLEDEGEFPTQDEEWRIFVAAKMRTALTDLELFNIISAIQATLVDVFGHFYPMKYRQQTFFDNRLCFDPHKKMQDAAGKTVSLQQASDGRKSILDGGRKSLDGESGKPSVQEDAQVGKVFDSTLDLPASEGRRGPRGSVLDIATFTRDRAAPAATAKPTAKATVSDQAEVTL